MSNKFKINSKGFLKPTKLERSFDKRVGLITNPTTNLNTTPLFYVGSKVNKLWSSTSPSSPYTFEVMKYGNSNLNLTVDLNGNYKIVNNQGKSFKLHNDLNGGYVKYNKQKIYL
jgi:hypothetical protein